MIKKLTLFVMSIILMMNPVVVEAYSNQDWVGERIEYIEQDPYYEDCSMFERMEEPLKRTDLAYIIVKAYELMRGEKVIANAPPFKDTTDDWVVKARSINLISG